MPKPKRSLALPPVPLSEAPWWAEQTVILLVAIVGALAVVVSSWVQHRRQNVRLERIEASAKTTEDHVANGSISHRETPMRDDIDAVKKAVAALSTDVSSMRSEFRGHVAQLADEQSRQTTEISLIRTEQIRQAETTAANKAIADATHEGIFRRLADGEARDRWRMTWPWRDRRG